MVWGFCCIELGIGRAAQIWVVFLFWVGWAEMR